MDTDNSEVLEIAKENIQPLRHGRKAAQLKTALQAQADPDVHQQLMKQREKFEFIIRMYEGDDPLEPYYNYILWLEQSFPCAGRENNIPLLLEDTLIKFKDCEKYRQDPRLAQLIIKYINIQPNSLELYQLVYNLGLGTMCSSLYKAWAEELEKANDFKRADQVFQLGLQCKAQPLQELQDAHVQFQLSIARKLLEGNVNSLTAPCGTDEQSRAVLSKLQPSKVRSSRVSKETAGIFTSSKNSSSQNTKSTNFSSGKFQVYREDSSDDQFQSRYKSETEVLPRGSTANRENIMGANKWCGQKVKQQASKVSSINSAPTFDIHEDPEAACDNIKTVIRPCALKVRKEEFKCPVAIFGPLNPNQQVMYPKQLVYVGGRDVQLEEIRAAFYWKKIEKQKQINSASEPNFSKFESEHCRETICLQQSPAINVFLEKQLLVEQNCEKAPSNSIYKSILTDDVYRDDDKLGKSDRYTKLFHSTDSQPMNGCDMMITPARPLVCADVYLGNDNPCAEDEKMKHVFSVQKSISTVQASRKSVFDEEDRSCHSNSTTKHDSAPFNKNESPKENDFKFVKPTGPVSKTKSIDVFVDDDCFPKRDFCKKHNEDSNYTNAGIHTGGPYFRKSVAVTNFKNTDRENLEDNQGLSTSITVNTKAAMNVIQQMWESPLTRQDTFEQDNLQLPGSSNKCLFPVYCEDDEPSVRKNEASNKISFPVYCDDSFSQPNNKYVAKPYVQAGSFASKFTQETFKSSGSLNKIGEPERKFGTPLPLIVPVKLQDSPVKPENKENRFPADYLSPEDSVYPHEESDEEEHFSGAQNCELDDETCNTRVFAVSLPSSTPCTLREKSKISRKSMNEESYLSHDDDLSICYKRAAPKLNNLHNLSECHKRCNKTNSDLSLILENSKEQGSGNSSSGSSGNTGSKLYFS